MFDFFEKISERIPESGIDVLFDIPNQLLEKIELNFLEKSFQKSISCSLDFYKR